MEPRTNDDAVGVEIAKLERIREFGRRQRRAGLAIGVVGALTYLVCRWVGPPYDGALACAGMAVALMAMLTIAPDSLRSRRGSLVAAWCFVGATWFLALLIGAGIWFGRH